jgi:hypothetical protein
MDEFGLVEFEFGLVDDLNENALDDTWMDDNPNFFGKL